MIGGKYLRDLRTFPRDAERAWRNDGLAGVWQEACVRTTSRVFEFWRGTIVELDLDAMPAVLPPLGVDIRPLVATDWPALSELVSARMLEHFRQAEARGRRGFVAWRGAQPIAYFWWSGGTDPELEWHGVRLPYDVIYFWYVYVVRAERHRGLGPALLGACLAEWRARGLRRGWMVIRSSNGRARHAARRLAGAARAQCVGRVAHLKLLGWVYVPFRLRSPGPEAEPSRWRKYLRKYLDDARTFPRAAALAWRRDGAFGIWDELCQRTIQRVYSAWRAEMLESDLAGMPHLAPPAGVEIELLSSPIGPALRRLAGERLLRHFERAHAEGRTCLVARRGGRPIGYVWYSTATDPGLGEYALPLPADAIYMWHLYVCRAERGRGVGAALESAGFAHAHARGFRRAWGAVERRNGGSVRIARRTTGGRAIVVGALTYRKLLARARARFDVA